jgi:hypothetical protein
VSLFGQVLLSMLNVPGIKSFAASPKTRLPLRKHSKSLMPNGGVSTFCAFGRGIRSGGLTATPFLGLGSRRPLVLPLPCSRVVYFICVLFNVVGPCPSCTKKKKLGKINLFKDSVSDFPTLRIHLS